MPALLNGGEVDLILGAGGPKGFGHFGGLRALEEFNVIPKRIIGVSIGSSIATLRTNKFSVDQCRDILLDELRNFDRSAVSRFFRSFNLFQLKRQGGLIDLRTVFEAAVSKYGLRPQPDLGIVAYDIDRRKPVLFEGTDYDLASAIAGSCSVPLMMRVTHYGQNYPSGMRLLDGALHHPCPVSFSPRPAIVFRLGLASKPPREKLPWYDRLLHMGERFVRPFWESRFSKPRREDLLITTGKPDVGTLAFTVSDKSYRDMEDYGYQVTKAALTRAVAEGKLVISS